MTHYTGVSSFGLKSNFKLEVLWKVSASDIILFFSHLEWLKFRYYEKAIKIWKNLPPVLTKQLFLLSSVKASEIFFQIFVAFSEKLNFKCGRTLQGIFIFVLSSNKPNKYVLKQFGFISTSHTWKKYVLFLKINSKQTKERH